MPFAINAGFVEVSGAETWATLSTFCAANSCGVTSGGVSLAMTLPVKLMDGSTLTVSARTLQVDAQYLPSQDSAPAIRCASTTSGRGRLVLRNGAVLIVLGAGVDAWDTFAVSPDFEDSEVILGNRWASFANLGARSDDRLVNVRVQCAGLYGLSQRWVAGSAATISGITFATNSIGSLVLAGSSKGLVLGNGISPQGDNGSYSATPTVLHSGMRVAGASSSVSIAASRAYCSYVFYDLKGGAGSRIWDIAYGTGGVQPPASEAARSACVWVFDPTVKNASGVAISGATWGVRSVAGSPFTVANAGVTNASGKVTGGITWGVTPTQQRTFTPDSGAYILKSQTPANAPSPVSSAIVPGYEVDIRCYGYLPVVLPGVTGAADVVGDTVLSVDPYVALSASQVAALTGIAFDGATVTLTGSQKTLDDVYSWLQLWYADPARIAVRAALTTTSSEYDLGAVSIVATCTVVAGARVKSVRTTGTVSASGGGSILFPVVDANGDSSLSFSGIDSWIVYSDAARTAQIGAGTGSQLFRFVYSSGVTYYLKCVTGSTEFSMVSTPAAAGNTEVTLSTQALLTALQGKVADVKADTGFIKLLSM